MNSNNAKSSCSREILDTGTFGFYDNSDENTKCSTTSRAAKFIAIHSSMQEHETIPVSKTRLTLATTSDTHDEWTEDCPPTPPSTAEVARMSLRGALRRSTSSRSITSTRSESIGSTSSHRAKLIISRSKSLVRCQQSPSLVVTNPSTSPRVGISARQFSSSILPRNVSYKNRINKLAEDARVRKIQQQKAQEEIKKRQRQYLQDEEKEAIADKAPMFTFMSSNYMVKNNIEPKTTSLGTLVCDLLLFHLLTLLTLPRYAIIGLWRFLFSKNWTARYKHVLITGASSPLGTETARQFATEGANLILIAHSGILDKDDLDLLASQCHELGSTKVRCYCADLSSTVSAELCFRQIAKDFDDTIDVVVLNGENMSHGCCFEEILDSTHIEKMIKDNTLCSMIALHFALKYIPKKSESRIVMLSSTSGLVSLPYKSVHAASHHALRGFCDSVRMELNDTYDHRAPKVCLASFPDLICQHTFQRKKVDHIVSYMGSENVPMKTRPWAGIPLQHAVNDLLQAVAAGKRDFGSPNYVRVWNCLRILFPDWIYFSVFRHIRKTQYRPIGNNSSKL